ncbi:MAG TPA: PAS domain S-box protein [Azospirillaceae bacterium]|nr:PAS domain S-box protein [Azospirillaceae bacterium]
MFDLMEAIPASLDTREDLPNRLLDLTSEGCWVGDSDLTTSYVNRAVCAMLGYTESEMLGRSLLEFVDEDGRATLERRQARREVAEHQTFELTLKRKSGGDVPAMINATRLVDARGHITGSFAFISNIAYRKRTEAFLMRLAEQEQLLASLSRPFLHADIGEAVHQALAAVGRFLRVDRSYIFYAEEGSPTYRRIHEWRAEDLRLQPGLDAPVLSDASWSVSTLKATGILQLEACQDFPVTACGGGELFASGDVQSSLVLPIQFERRFMGFVGVDSIRRERRWGADDANLLRRVSEIIAMGLRRREVEEDLRDQIAFQRRLIETIPSPVFYKDLDGRYLGSNRALEAITGRPREAIVGKTVFDLFPEDVARGYYESDRRLLAEGGAQVSEALVPYADGEARTAILNRAVFHDADGNKRGIIGVIQDITDHIRAEQALEVSRSELEQLNQQKNRFFSIIAHDLKNPFNAILGFTDILAESADRLPIDKIQFYARSSHEAGRQVLSLLENLLEWARLQMNRMVFQPAETDLALVAQACVDLLTANAGQKGVTLENAIDIGTLAFCDHAMTETTVRNLVNNAVKFTPEGGRVTVSATPLDEDWITVTVSDTGIGMTAEQIDRLFRLDEYNTTPGTDGETGSGLGLLLSKNLTERQGGQLFVTSTPGEGSTFRFTLPRRAPVSVEPGLAKP